MSDPVNFFGLIAHASQLPTVLVATWLVMALLLVFGYAARLSLRRAPDPTLPDEGLTFRHFAEVIAEWLDGFVAHVGTSRFSAAFSCLS
jgi:hypothetical protein